MLGFLQVENTVMVVALGLIAVRLIGRLSERTSLIGGLVLYVIGYTIVTGSSNPGVLFGAMAIATVGEIFSAPTRQSFIGDLSLVSNRGAYLAVNGLTSTSSRLLAGLGVVLGAAVHTNVMVGVILFIGLMGMVLYLRVLPIAQQRRKLSDQTGAVTGAK